MPVLPANRNELITFCEVHILPWATNQANIGISAQNVTDLTTATTAARADHTAALAARNAAKSATNDHHISADALRLLAAEIVKRIKVHAEATNDLGVYSLAEIPAPLPAEALPPPPIPTSPTGLVNNNGQVEVSWSSPLKGRIFFRIERQVVPTNQPADAWEFRSAVTEKKYIDTEIPANATSVLYRIASMRSDQLSLFSDPVQVMLATPGAAVA